MKDRIKKFYKDHEQTIKDTTIVVGSISSCMAVAAFYAYVTGRRSVDVEGLWTGHAEDGSGDITKGFRVALTNGREAYFFPPVEAA